MRIVYLANVDWFFVSHFLHLAQRARQQGWEVAIAANMGAARQRLIDEGFDVIDLPVRRGGVLPLGLFGAAGIVAKNLQRSPDTILHGFGLFGILVGTVAGLRSGVRKRVFTITGRGYSAVSQSLSAKLIRLVSGLFCSSIADSSSTRWFAENKADLFSCRLNAAMAEGRTAVAGGAGVDLQVLDATLLPPSPPLKCALVARMIWSKGVDVAVAAVGLARARGLDVELSLAGPLDPDNPRSLTPDDMRQFTSQPGVRWLGRIADINGFWATQHIAVLPSRGGEGIPKALIEAAACGRPVLTTDVPGCREFAAATDGWCVPPDDAQALAAALLAIAATKDLSQRGAAARSAVAANYTQDKLWELSQRFYSELSGVQAQSSGHVERSGHETRG
ncbi:MAG: glycosyltransferase [Hyphomicrobium sp.]